MIDFEKLAADTARQCGSLVTAKEMMDLFGLSKGRISQLTTEGVFVKDGQGYDLKTSVKNYLRLARTAAASAPLMAAKVTRARADARKALVEADLAEGAAVKIDVIEAAMAEMGAAVAGAMKSMRQSLPARLAGLNAEKIAVILEADIRRVMALIYDSHLTSFKGCHDHSTDR